jgi:hypothetical protein
MNLTENKINDCAKLYFCCWPVHAYVPVVNKQKEQQGVFNHKERFRKFCTHFCSQPNATQEEDTGEGSVQTIDPKQVC